MARIFTYSIIVLILSLAGVIIGCIGKDDSPGRRFLSIEKDLVNAKKFAVISQSNKGKVNYITDKTIKLKLVKFLLDDMATRPTLDEIGFASVAEFEVVFVFENRSSMHYELDVTQDEIEFFEEVVAACSQ